MPAKIQLKEGDYIDSEHNLIYIREAERRNDGRRRIGVYDLEYDEYFEADLNDLRRGHTKHSKKTSYSVRSKKQTKWNPGESRIIYGEPILMLKEIEPLFFGEDKHRIRRCRFQNLRTMIVFECDIASVISGSSSGTRKSRGERIIAQILSQLNIEYIEQHIFYDCRSSNNRVLYFDFYLPDYNCCIEYDGEQHFKGWLRDISTLEQIQNRDEIKNKYCNDKHIHLIRIPYTQLNKLNEDYIMNLLNSKQDAKENI